jgi:hypothetical protein
MRKVRVGKIIQDCRAVKSRKLRLFGFGYI